MLRVQQVAVNQVPAFLSLLINILNARGKDCLTENIIMFLSPLQNLKIFLLFTAGNLYHSYGGSTCSEIFKLMSLPSYQPEILSSFVKVSSQGNLCLLSTST